jgi:hypothetical protein
MIDQLWKRQIKELILRDDVPIQDIAEIALRNVELVDALHRLKSSALVGDRPVRDLQHVLSLVGTEWLLTWIAQQELLERKEIEIKAA